MSCLDNCNVGTGQVVISGIGRYTGKVIKTFEIYERDISLCEATLEQSKYTYDGTNKQPSVTVKDGEKTLSGYDYEVSYTSNKNVGKGIVTIIGKRNYEGTITKYFDIEPIELESQITLSNNTYRYDGMPKRPTATVTQGNVTLILDTDYTISYNNNIEVGTATVTITGKGNYAGTQTVTFEIRGANIEETVTGQTYTYDGSNHGITVKVTNPTSGATVKYGTEKGKYTLGESPKFTQTGTYKVYYIITADSYTSKEGEATITINPKNINSSNITLNNNTYTYDGTAKQPTTVVKDGEKTLTENTDYTKSYSNNINAGTATVTITGNGNYTGTLTKNYTIEGQNITGFNVTVNKSTYKYDGTAKEIEVTVKNGTIVLQKDRDYTVEYTNNIEVGTATALIRGKGNYTGTIAQGYTIIKGEFNIQVTGYDNIYDQKEHGITINITNKPNDLIIKYGTEEGKYNLDKSPTYTEVGTYKIYYKVTSNSYEEKTGSLTIRISEKDIGTTTITLEQQKYSYDTLEKEPQVTIKDGQKTLEENKDYTVKYENNKNAGLATVTIEGKGNYNKTTTRQFIIEKGEHNYTVPSGIITAYGNTLKDVTLPERFTWEDDLDTPVGEIGNNIFTCTYTPKDQNNYNIITGIEVTIKVTEKLEINFKKYSTKESEEDATIYIKGIPEGDTIKEIKEIIETNGDIKIYDKEGNEITEESKIAKTGMKVEITTEAEEAEYIITVVGDLNRDGRVNNIDLLKLARYILKIDTKLEEEQVIASDIYEDEEVDDSDLQKLAKTLIELEPIEPKTKEYSTSTLIQLNGKDEILQGEVQELTFNISSEENVGIIQGKLSKNAGISNLQIISKNNDWIVTYDKKTGKFNAINANGTNNGEVIKLTYELANNATSGEIKITDMKLITTSYDVIEVPIDAIKNVTKKEEQINNPSQDTSTRPGQNDNTTSGNYLPATGMPIVLKVITVMLTSVLTIGIVVYKKVKEYRQIQ